MQYTINATARSQHGVGLQTKPQRQPTPTKLTTDITANNYKSVLSI